MDPKIQVAPNQTRHLIQGITRVNRQIPPSFRQILSLDQMSTNIPFMKNSSLPLKVGRLYTIPQV